MKLNIIFFLSTRICKILIRPDLSFWFGFRASVDPDPLHNNIKSLLLQVDPNSYLGFNPHNDGYDDGGGGGVILEEAWQHSPSPYPSLKEQFRMLMS